MAENTSEPAIEIATNKEVSIGVDKATLNNNEKREPVSVIERNRKRTRTAVTRGRSLGRSMDTSYKIPKNMDLIAKNKVALVEKTKLEEKEKLEASKISSNHEDKSFYVEGINMPRAHQEFLYKECQKQGLDFKKVMALISLESSFNQNNISRTNDYGYMQINKGNHSNLARVVGTKNAPLDPHTNMLWGTHMLGDLNRQWKSQGISSTAKPGKVFSELDEYVMSSYNKGVAGFKRHGKATRYINIAEVKYRELYN